MSGVIASIEVPRPIPRLIIHGMTDQVNVDAAELAKFSELAHRWWDLDSEFRPLHEINPLRLDWIESVIPVKGCQVLDVGCGGGILADAMARRGAQVLGIDLAERALKVAKLHALEADTRGVKYRDVSAEALAEEQPETFDIVTCMEMLEHVPQPASVVAACARLVKPGGWVFFSTINRNAKAFAFAIVGAEYVLGMLPRGTHEYRKLIRPSELAAYSRAAGLDLRHTRGMEYNPLTRRYWLSADTSVNYLFATRKRGNVVSAGRPALAVLFDLDGTLIDSAADLGAAADKMRTDRGMEPLALDRYRPMAGAGARGMLGVAFGIAPDAAEFNALREEFFVNYEARMLESTRAFAGVGELIAKLCERAVPWGVVTNKSARFTDPLTRAMPLFGSAGAIVSGDTTPFSKPHPEPLLEAARRLRVAPSVCIYVGDDERDMVAGRAAGMRTVAATYGYLGERADATLWQADAAIASPLELLQWIEQA